MKSLLTLWFTLTITVVFAQLQNRSVNSMGGAVSGGGSLETIIVVGDPGASTDIGIAGSQELYSGFVAANFFGTLAAGDSISVQDSLALVALYNDAGGLAGTWSEDSNWIQGPVRTWHGVGIDGNRVVNLNLSNNGLSGFINDSIRGLTALVNLDLSGNELTRDIPAGLGTMQALRFVNLSNNNLNGFLPDSLGLATNLTNLNLANNQLSGEFRQALTNMVSLTELNISNNQLIGLLPDSLGRLSNLEQLDLSDNSIEGELPASMSDLINLKFLDLSNNLLEGVLPDLSGWSQVQVFDVSSNDLNGSLGFLTTSDSLSTVNISNNSFTTLPDLSGSLYDLVDVSGNQLDFGDLEPNASLQNFTFAPQDSLGVETDSLVQQGAVVDIFFDIAGSSNFYQWIFNGDTLDGEEFDTYSVIGATSANDGIYVLAIGNDLLPGLTLYTRPYQLVVSSLQRDQQVLEAIYAATGGGDAWTATNWGTGSLADTEWEGVFLNASETGVEALVLPGKGLRGQMPRDIRFLANLDSLDLSDNELTRFPDISRYDLSYLDLSDNRLAFGSLVPNKGAVATANDYIFSPQKRFGVERDSIAQAGDDILIPNAVPGRGNQYTWFFDDFKIDTNAVAQIEGTSLPYYTIDDIDYDKMGKYYVEVTNNDLTGLTITTFPWDVRAKDDIFGRVFADTTRSSVLTEGELVIYRKTREGPFIPEDTTFVDQLGDYVFEDIVLGDFILKVDPADQFVDILQTYYVREDDWVRADELQVRRKTTAVDIEMLFNPGDFEENPDNTGTIGGELFTDFEDETARNLRIDARRRVKKAGCSLRRRVTGGGRTDQDGEFELVAYVETDDNGNFSFNNIPDGEYRINIQYPGVPMDESTQIDFVIGGNGTTENDSFTLEAVITEDGIAVEVIEALGDLKPFLKDVVLYPNPTQGMLKFDYRVYRPMNELTAELFDMRGNKMMEQQLEVNMGVQHAELDMTALSAGTYLLRLTNGDASFTSNLRIVKE